MLSHTFFPIPFTIIIVIFIVIVVVILPISLLELGYTNYKSTGYSSTIPTTS